MTNHQPGFLGRFDETTRVRGSLIDRQIDDNSISRIRHHEDSIVIVVAMTMEDILYVVTAHDVGWVLKEWVVGL